MGNRGRLHQGRGTRDIVRNHQHKTWITCALSFRGRRVAQWEPNRYTPLFFLDEAVALAAGHRPCGECRHRAYREYPGLWAETTAVAQCLTPRTWTPSCIGSGSAGGHRAPWGRAARWRVRRHRLRARRRRPVTISRSGTNDDNSLSGQADTPRCRRRRPCCTPPSIVEILRAGYPVQIDGSAR